MSKAQIVVFLMNTLDDKIPDWVERHEAITAILARWSDDVYEQVQVAQDA